MDSAATSPARGGVGCSYLSLKAVTAMHSDEIREAVLRVVDSGWYLQGAETKAFEREYAEYIGTRHCIGCGNGLDALTLILRAYIELGVMKEGDEVIVPANTYIATILSITENRLTPVLIEPQIENFQIDDSKIEAAITERTRAVMIVHLYGCCAYTQRIGEICKAHGLLLLEDNAQAQGCRFAPSIMSIMSTTSIMSTSSTISKKESQTTGSLGNAAAHSFYPGKNLGALGDAGAVTTDDDELAATVRRIANYGSDRKYVFDSIGRNSRIDEIHAAVLRVKLKYLDEENNRRREIARMIINGVDNERIMMPKALLTEHQPEDEKRDCVFHILPVLCETRDDLQRYLAENGIQTMIHYPIPPHKQRCYPHLLPTPCSLLPITEKIHREELSIPCNQTMTDEETAEIIALLNNY